MALRETTTSLGKLLQHLCRGYADSLAYAQELNHVKLPLPAFILGDERLWALQFFGNLGLRERSIPPCFGKDGAKLPVRQGMGGSGHLPMLNPELEYPKLG